MTWSLVHSKFRKLARGPCSGARLSPRIRASHLCLSVLPQTRAGKSNVLGGVRRPIAAKVLREAARLHCASPQVKGRHRAPENAIVPYGVPDRATRYGNPTAAIRARERWAMGLRHRRDGSAFRSRSLAPGLLAHPGAPGFLR